MTDGAKNGDAVPGRSRRLRTRTVFPRDGVMNSLVLSALDYRTSRKANMQFIARELAARGPTRFFSLRYSLLSRWKADPRLELDDRANAVECYEGVECYLWKSLIHPFNTRRPWLRPTEDMFFRHWRSRPPAVLLRWVREADYILFESGSSIAFVRWAKVANPKARLIYVASDDLDTIDVAQFVKDEFTAVATLFDAVCLPSPLLVESMPAGARIFHVPHGLDDTIGHHEGPSPYADGVHAVSVGSMLFDRGFFDVAASLFPDVTFHVIGSGSRVEDGWPSNVKVYPEMRFEDTIPYIRHARFGIAPYRSEGLSPYLADTSMKLMQYRFFGLPAVCPSLLVNAAQDRFGYADLTGGSVGAAIRGALSSKGADPSPVLSWREVTDRLLAPTDYADTALPRLQERESAHHVPKGAR